MVRLVRQVEAAADGDLSLEWLHPFGSSVRFAAGQAVFREGDEAGEMYYVEGGVFRIPERGIEIRAGSVVGELGLLSPGNRRTASRTCIEAGQAPRLSDSDV